MTSDQTKDFESADAQKIDLAVEAIANGELEKAEALLLNIIENTPAKYSNFEENDEGISIKFWDQTAFIHYVTWQKQQGLTNKNIQWINNVYPRAHYYMGYLCVKKKEFDRAIEFLDKGLNLEPTNPIFICEKAQASVLSGRKEEALALYQQVNEISPYVGAFDIAVALRGQGFVLIEMGNLDKAENAFKSSLEIEPDNEVALNELQYIAHLRQGGTQAFAETVPLKTPNLSNCVVCGKEFDDGIVVSFNGMPVSVCKMCENKLSKKWWEFWK